MVLFSQEKNKANHLRKSRKYSEALSVYRNLWKDSGDEFDGAGYLHCLRKLDMLDEAVPIAKELTQRGVSSDWCRGEIIWTLIKAELDRCPQDLSVDNIVEKCQRIMEFKPDGLAAKIVVFKVLKSAKSENRWDIINEWVVRLDPDSLSSTPMVDRSGRKGWSDRALWYNYRIKGLLEEGRAQDAIDVVDGISDHFPGQKMFFGRLKGLALYRLGKLPEAEIIYKGICNSRRPDWWLLHEYARVVKDIGDKECALRLMYRALNAAGKLDLTVTLLLEVGLLCSDLGRNQEARDHLVLCKSLRENRGWSIPSALNSAIESVRSQLGTEDWPSTLAESRERCRHQWRKDLSSEMESPERLQHKRQIRRGLAGVIKMGGPARLFCFIITHENESVFCFKSDLPPGSRDGGTVVFDALPSFDRKKNKESWKAGNVKPQGQ